MTRSTFVIGVICFLGGFAIAGAIAAWLIHKDGNTQPDDVPEAKAAPTAREAFAQITAAKNADAADLRRQLYQFRFAHPATPEAMQASLMLTQLPSPLDELDAARIPASERYPWQPRELVAVLGTHAGRHWDWVTGVAISSDGKLVASCGRDGLRLWDGTTLRQIDSREHSDFGVETVAFAPDGKALVYAARGDVYWFKLGPQKLEALDGLNAHHDRVVSLQFARDGKVLLSVAKDGEAILWDTSTRQLKRAETFKLADRIAFAEEVAFSENGRTIAFAPNRDRRERLGIKSKESGQGLTIWDIVGGRPDQRLEKRIELMEVSGPIALSSDGGTLAASTNRKTTIAAKNREEEKLFGGKELISVLSEPSIWKISDKSAIKHGSIPIDAESFILLDNGKKLLARGYRKISIWDVSVAEPKQVLDIKDAESTFACSADGKVLATADPVRIWDIAAADRAKERVQSEGHGRDVLDLLISEQTTLVSTAGGGETRVWDLARGRVSLRGVFGSSAVDGIALRPFIAPDGRRLCLPGHLPKGFQVWDLEAEGPRERARFSEIAPPMALSPDGTTLVAVDRRDPETRLARVNFGEVPPRILETLPTSADSLAFSPDGKILAIQSRIRHDDGLQPTAETHLWDMTGPQAKQRATLKAQGRMAFSPDARFLVVAGRFKIEIWRLADLQSILKIDGSGFDEPTLSFMSDGKYLLTQFGTANPRLWEFKADGPSEVKTAWDGQTGSFRAFSPDGRIMAATHEKRVQLFDMATYKKSHDWELDGRVTRVAFADDGRHLFLGNGNGSIYILRLAAAPPRKTR